MKNLLRQERQKLLLHTRLNIREVTAMNEAKINKEEKILFYIDMLIMAVDADTIILPLKLVRAHCKHPTWKATIESGIIPVPW